MKNLTLILGLAIGLCQAKEVDYSTLSVQTAIGLQKEIEADDHSIRYCVLGNHALNNLRLDHKSQSFCLNFTLDELTLSSHSPLYEQLCSFARKYNLSCLFGSIKIPRKALAETCVHEALLIIGRHIPLSPSTIEEICHFMGVPHPESYRRR
ncbi:hypothetical protein [Candidatus Odyssella thessalonicensis]|uniref:hypothetical protein n=1 Tax=Candidatus Odyssella thessalonicensis TaxID=84647 RepID=UPI000225A92D|nr:hypothetical protein [Candidatus Odyssella thessalonicensis]